MNMKKVLSILAAISLGAVLVGTSVFADNTVKRTTIAETKETITKPTDYTKHQVRVHCNLVLPFLV